MSELAVIFALYFSTLILPRKKRANFHHIIPSQSTRLLVFQALIMNFSIPKFNLRRRVSRSHRQAIREMHQAALYHASTEAYYSSQQRGPHEHLDSPPSYEHLERRHTVEGTTPVQAHAHPIACQSPPPPPQYLRHPLTVRTNLPRLGIEASSIPQWRWSRDDCQAWLSKYLSKKMGLTEGEAHRTALHFADNGAGVYLWIEKRWINLLGETNGKSMYAMLVSFRNYDGAVPSNVHIGHGKDFKSCMS